MPLIAPQTGYGIASGSDAHTYATDHIVGEPAYTVRRLTVTSIVARLAPAPGAPA